MMEFTNFCKRYKRDMIVKLYKYAQKLEAEECIIHTNGSISLYCKDGIICEHYNPTARELH